MNATQIIRRMKKAAEQLMECCPTDEMEDAIEALEEGLERAELAVESAREAAAQ